MFLEWVYKILKIAPRCPESALRTKKNQAGHQELETSKLKKHLWHSFLGVRFRKPQLRVRSGLGCSTSKKQTIMFVDMIWPYMTTYKKSKMMSNGLQFAWGWAVVSEWYWCPWFVSCVAENWGQSRFEAWQNRNQVAATSRFRDVCEVEQPNPLRSKMARTPRGRVTRGFSRDCAIHCSTALYRNYNGTDWFAAQP